MRPLQLARAFYLDAGWHPSCPPPPVAGRGGASDPGPGRRAVRAGHAPRRFEGVEGSPELRRARSGHSGTKSAITCPGAGVGGVSEVQGGGGGGCSFPLRAGTRGPRGALRAGGAAAGPVLGRRSNGGVPRQARRARRWSGDAWRRPRRTRAAPGKGAAPRASHASQRHGPCRAMPRRLQEARACLL